MSDTSMWIIMGAGIGALLVGGPIGSALHVAPPVPEVLMASADTVIGDWEYVERVDAMTDEVLREARTKTASGFEFSVFRIESGAVHALFRVPDSSSDVLDSGRYPMYRIDQHDPTELESTRAIAEFLDEPPILAEPKWVQFLMWHGSDPYPESGTLRNLIDGEVILFRYYLFTGGYKEVPFSLEGARETIGLALELSSPGGR